MLMKIKQMLNIHVIGLKGLAGRAACQLASVDSFLAAYYLFEDEVTKSVFPKKYSRLCWTF